MTQELILVAYPSSHQRNRIQGALESGGFQVLVASDARSAWVFTSSHPPAAVIIGNTRGLDGMSLCRYLRAEEITKKIPILVLHTSGGEPSRMAALEAGADDTLVRPYTLREFTARVRALVRRTSRQVLPEKILQRGDLVLDAGRYQVTFQGKTVDLSVAEFQILWFLSLHPGRVLSRNEIVEGCFGTAVLPRVRIVDVYMVSIRQKLGPELIQTISGVGYRLRDRGRRPAKPPRRGRFKKA
jgi:two-component system alkaline phosphatase synthesis response regulator PhoP